MFLDSNLVLWMFLSLPLSLHNSLREENESTCCSSTSSSSPIPLPYHLFIVPLPHPYTCLSYHWRGLRSESGLFKFSSSSSFDLLLNKRTLIQLIKTLYSCYSRSALGSTPFAVLLCPNDLLGKSMWPQDYSALNDTSFSLKPMWLSHCWPDTNLLRLHTNYYLVNLITLPKEGNII